MHLISSKEFFFGGGGGEGQNIFGCVMVNFILLPYGHFNKITNRNWT